MAGLATLAFLGVVGCGSPGGRPDAPPPRGSDAPAPSRSADSAISAASADPGSSERSAIPPISAIEFPPLRFDPPEPERYELSNGVSVFYLRDPSLPLVNVFIELKGGYVYFPRAEYAAATAVGSLMKNAGAGSMTSDSLDEAIEFHALGTRVASDGGRVLVGVEMLRRQLDVGLGIWSAIVLRPRFEAEAVERWRIRELETVRRIQDFPGSLAVQEFNEVMFGDHPTGWRMTRSDLTPEKVTPARIREIHGRIACPERAVIGASGDIEWPVLEAALEEALAGWEPCGTELPERPMPDLRSDPAVFVLHKPLPQSTIVVGQPGGVLLRDDADYYASRLANWIIGGSGFTSRLMSRLRTEEGLAYSAATVWGAARRHERIFGAITHTRAERTADALELVLETLADVVANPPGEDEVELARTAIVNGFVFGFESPAQIVSRQVTYWADGLPADWLNRYLEGVRATTTEAVATVVRRHIDPSTFTILVVGDTAEMGLDRFGPVTVLPGRRP